jgi:hypothetical protein
VENDDRPNLFSVADLKLVHQLTGVCRSLGAPALAAARAALRVGRRLSRRRAINTCGAAAHTCTHKRPHTHTHTSAGIPIVFDFHHWRFCSGGQTQEQAFRDALATWPAGARLCVCVCVCVCVCEVGGRNACVHAVWLAACLPAGRHGRCPTDPAAALRTCPCRAHVLTAPCCRCAHTSTCADSTVLPLRTSLHSGVRPVVHWSECPEDPNKMLKAHSGVWLCAFCVFFGQLWLHAACVTTNNLRPGQPTHTTHNTHTHHNDNNTNRVRGRPHQPVRPGGPGGRHDRGQGQGAYPAGVQVPAPVWPARCSTRDCTRALAVGVLDRRRVGSLPLAAPRWCGVDMLGDLCSLVLRAGSGSSPVSWAGARARVAPRTLQRQQQPRRRLTRQRRRRHGAAPAAPAAAAAAKARALTRVVVAVTRRLRRSRRRTVTERRLQCWHGWCVCWMCQQRCCAL